MRGRPLRALPVRARLRLPGGPGVAPRPTSSTSSICGRSDGGRRSRSSRSGSSPPATAASSACSTARTSCSTLAGEIEIAYFLEARRATVEGPYDLSLVEGSITTPEDAERIQQVRRVVAAPGHDRRLRDGRRHPGASQLRGRARSSSRLVYATPEYISTLETSTPISAHVPVDFELQGCPINKHQLLEVISAFLDRAPAADPRAQRLHRVQAPRQRLRDGRPRHPLPRPGDARRLRRALPLLQPRLLRLLRADGDPQHGLARGLDASSLGVERARPRPRLPQLQRSRPSRSAGRARRTRRD